MNSPSTFYSPLRFCIEKHPYLSVTVGDLEAEKSYYLHISKIDLVEHISILKRQSASDDVWADIEEILRDNLEVSFPQRRPPWRIAVLPLLHGCFVAFCYSHTIGDGLTGKAFHTSLLNAFNGEMEGGRKVWHIVHVPARPLPPPFDTHQQLPISWLFLLSPFLSLLLPHFISKILGLRASAATTDAGTWTGSAIPQCPEKFHSRIKIWEIEGPVLKTALLAMRERNVKLTGIFQGLIVQALSKTICDAQVTNSVSQTAINMRKCVSILDNKDREFVLGCYIIHPQHLACNSFSNVN